ncbi:hypothetical protein B0H13DRAFT_1858515 [Mycena leptocephala]|nr:hypothetical protein B0H13DRAFT_1858515 [Mycena leptocephala]
MDGTILDNGFICALSGRPADADILLYLSSLFVLFEPRCSDANCFSSYAQQSQPGIRFQETRVSALENCRDFTIQGGTFNVSTTVEQPQGNFRVVKLGDLNLLDEIDKQNVVEWHPIHRKKMGVVVRHVKVIVGTRRIYRARIFGSQDPMTAVVYNDAQFEQARHHLHIWSLPYIFLRCREWLKYGKAHNFGRWFCSPLRQFSVADSYWEETTGGRLYYLPGTAWIRLSTGKLCMDVGNGYEPCGDVVPSPRFWTPEMPSLKLTENDLAGKLKCTLELDEFYSLLTRGNRAFLQISSSTPGTITAPSIYNPNCNHAHFEPDGFCAIPTAKHLTVDDLYIDSWSTSNLPQEVLPTGWTRVDYPECHSHPFWIAVGLKDYIAPMKWWLSQQHYVCDHLQRAFNATELITGISFNCTLNTHVDSFTLQGTFMADAPTDKVYLFLFTPQVDIVENLLTVTNPPDTKKYYWAFDPAGLNQLTHDMAEDFGLPTVEFSTTMWGTVGMTVSLIWFTTFMLQKGSIHTAKTPPSPWAIL